MGELFSLPSSEVCEDVLRSRPGKLLPSLTKVSRGQLLTFKEALEGWRRDRRTIVHVTLDNYGVEQAPLSLKKTSTIGSCGSHSQNCHRDFLALVATKTKICKPLQEKVLFKDGLYLQSIMLPHELFHCMWKEYKEYFIHAVAPGGSNRLVSFWKNFEKHPCMQSGAMTAIRQRRSYPHRCCAKVLVHMPNV